MVFILSETYRPPLFEEIWIKEGKPVTQLYEFIDALSSLYEIYGEGILGPKRYADLAGVQAEIVNPKDGYTVMFEGQGLGTYNEGASEWRLSADDTTAVT